MTRTVGRYEILEEVGRGGMAIVFRAHQTDLDRTVALKELSAFHASDPAFARRFLRESRLAGSLSHPNIVTVHEYFEHEGTPYIAMEYIERGSLRPYVGRLTLAQMVGVIEGMLAGLTHAETKGVVHRDIKPENVMVTGEGRVKIADFGIAKAGSGVTGQFLTATGTTVGTPAYMAPEQALGQEVGPWTDLYSLGVMAYEMLVGRLPFAETEAPMALLMKHVNEPVPPPESIRPDLDPELTRWLGQLLEKVPQERIGSAAAAWDELEESVIRIFGARWRREARLPEQAASADTPRPLTPAAFAEVAEEDAPPADAAPADAPPADAAPADAPPEPPSEETDSGFQSFAWRQPARPPARPPPEPAAPAPVEPAPVEPDVAAAAEAAPETEEEEADPEPQAAPAADFVTYGRRDEPAAPVVEPPPEPEPEPEPEPAAETEPEPEPETADLQAGDGEEPAAWPATVAPRATPAPPAPPEPVRKRPEREPAKRPAGAGPLVLVALAVAIGAGIGWLVAPSSKQQDKPAAASSSASNDTFQLGFPAGWRRTSTAPQVNGLRLSDPVTLAGTAGAGTVVAGTSDADGPTLLPKDLRDRLAAPAQATAVKLGPAAAYRYSGLAARSPNERLTVYAIPTTKGAVTVACLGAAVTSADCSTIASTLRLRGARAYALGPDPAYARALDQAMTSLNTDRARNRSALSEAKTPAAQASAARALSATYGSTAAALRGQPVSPADRAANDQIVSALDAAKKAYADLAAAARKGDKKAFAAASSDVQKAEQQVAAAVGALQDLGYSTA